MKKQTNKLFDKLRQTLLMSQEIVNEFTFYDSEGIKINETHKNLNILEVTLLDVITNMELNK